MKANTLKQAVTELPKRSRYVIESAGDVNMTIRHKQTGKVHLISPREYEIIEEANRLMANN